ncbi:murein biosynthesis integral membrane protein MurJ [Streptomyces sp. MMS21 TC-5]|uniref:murein biosynthesis integral membrane protein MurJ n=1 Tax=Streptomyces TaxID=1883 RepID=UPI0006AEF1D8|nr:MULTISPECIES: murein biosynthesis integral membrane protein MurJ [unclassified Streptomyces]KOV17665.1 membrane protein [Streptomyces sp. XY511]MCI4082564.1 murein biosynthesis integral membrane protein MurJ [Streptomyces sp. MMS21 TC-5]
MNAPYDGDRAQGTGGPAPSQGTAPGTPVPGQVPAPAPAPDHDPYVQDAYDYDPYRSQDLSAQDPVGEVLYDRAAHPPPPPGTFQEPGPLYAAPAAPMYSPDPRVWAQTPPPEPDGPSRHLPYGDHATTTEFVGVDSLVTRAAEEQPEPDAFAHLYRDQEAAPRTPVEDTPVAAPAPAKPAGRAASLLKSSALMAAGTIVSRITGFLRTLVIAAAIGVGTFNDTYQIANTLPTMIYVLVGGGALNAVFIPQLVRAMKNDDDGGEAYANRLLTLVVVLLAGITTICVLAAPVFITMMSPKIASDPQQMDVAVAFARYCLPTMFFMGVHVVLGQILNARGRFGAMMWTPVLNNIVVIATFGAFIWAFGGFTTSGVNATTVTPEGVRLLGLGTLLGLTVQALAMLPYLRDAGFKPRLRFDWKGHGLGKAARLAKWTFFFVLANQIGLVIVTQLATWAGSVAEKQGHPGTGITAYNYALLLWQMPQAIITVSVMTAVLPRISRSAHDGDAAAVRDDISYGLRTSAVAIVPCAFAFLALGVPMATLLYAGSGSGAQNIGYVLMAFGLGLIPYSVQYVVLRGFYAYEDTRTPFYNTVIVAAVNAAGSAISFFVLPARWAVVGMAASYGLGYAVGVGVAWRRLRTRLGGDLDGAHVMRTYARLTGACVPAAAVAGAAAFGVTQWLGSGVLGSATALVAGGIALAAVFLIAAKRMRIEELNAMVGMVRGRLGR